MVREVWPPSRERGPEVGLPPRAHFCTRSWRAMAAHSRATPCRAVTSAARRRADSTTRRRSACELGKAERRRVRGMADGQEITPAFIAEQFVRQYYSAMHKDPVSSLSRDVRYVAEARAGAVREREAAAAGGPTTQSDRYATCNNIHPRPENRAAAAYGPAAPNRLTTFRRRPAAE